MFSDNLGLSYDIVIEYWKLQLTKLTFQTRNIFFPTLKYVVMSIMYVFKTEYIDNIWRINKNISLQYIHIKLRTIYLSFILFLHSLKHTQEARGASGHVIHTLVFFFKQKIIVRDHRSRHPQTLSICCILIDGDIIQMNFSTIYNTDQYLMII